MHQVIVIMINVSNLYLLFVCLMLEVFVITAQEKHYKPRDTYINKNKYKVPILISFKELIKKDVFEC